MFLQKIDETYSKILWDFHNSDIYLQMQSLNDVLLVERDGWRYDWSVRMGRRSKFTKFFEELGNGEWKLPSGILEIPRVRGILKLPPVEYPSIEDSAASQDFLYMVDELDLPFEPRGYQVEAAAESLARGKTISLMCTGSGKSLTISLILEWFRRKGLRGCLVVPNINLLTQFSKDIKSYNLMDLHRSVAIWGGNKKDKWDESKNVLITTWQSLGNAEKSIIENFDFVVCDEVHRFASFKTSKIIRGATKATFKLGFTGTLPDNRVSKMMLIGMFGLPKRYISSKELIDSGWGTNIQVTSIKLQHKAISDHEISLYTEYLDRLKYMISLPERTDFIANLAKGISSKGPVLVLYTLIEHGEAIYSAITGERPGGISRQRELNGFFMNGSVKADDRELMRNIMDAVNEDTLFESTQKIAEHPILVANYSLLSTGVNIKRLRSVIFASPLKSFTTITQSLGRGIRKSDGKNAFDVFDIVDIFKNVKTFTSQYYKREKIYRANGFLVAERIKESL